MGSTSAKIAAIAATVGGAPSLGDPRDMDRSSVVGANLYRASATTSSFTATAAFTGAADAIDRIPGAADVDSNWTEAVYKTLLSYTGRGALFYVVGPTLATSGDIFTVEITRDGGTAVEIPIKAQANASRCILGPLKREGDVVTAAIFKGLEHTGASTDSLTAYVAGNQTILSPGDLLRDGFVPLRFNSSILVRGKISSSGGLSTTTNQERRCAVIVRNLA